MEVLEEKREQIEEACLEELGEGDGLWSFLECRLRSCSPSADSGDAD